MADIPGAEVVISAKDVQMLSDGGPTPKIFRDVSVRWTTNVTGVISIHKETGTIRTSLVDAPSAPTSKNSSTAPAAPSGPGFVTLDLIPTCVSCAKRLGRFPGSTTTRAGQFSQLEEDCVCRPGFYRDLKYGDSGECRPCLAGMVCDWDFRVNTTEYGRTVDQVNVHAQPGYHLMNYTEFLADYPGKREAVEKGRWDTFGPWLFGNLLLRVRTILRIS